MALLFTSKELFTSPIGTAHLVAIDFNPLQQIKSIEKKHILDFQRKNKICNNEVLS
jgi:hypothetical protein